MKARATEFGPACRGCDRLARKARDCPDVPLECPSCGPIREVAP